MSENQGGKPERKLGMDFGDLSMNEVPQSASAESEETGGRKSPAFLIALGVIIAAVVIFLGARVISNAPPGEEAEGRLRAKLENLSVWQHGLVLRATYVAGNRVRLEFAPSVPAASDEGRQALRSATKEVMTVLIGERPGRDLYIDGYQGDEDILHAEYRAKSTLVGPGGEQIPDIVVRIKGEPAGGMGQAYENTKTRR